MSSNNEEAEEAVTAINADGALAKTVEFDADRRATVVKESPGADAAGVTTALGLDDAIGRPVLLVCGGANDLGGAALERARQVVGPAVSAAAELVDMTVIDGGTATGVMSLTGAARAEHPADLSVLLGVAPAGEVTYPGAQSGNGTQLDANHTHFALADADQWGAETPMMMSLGTRLAGGAPMAMLLAGGGDVAKREVLEAVKRRWPIFVVVGTGGTADEVAGAWSAYRNPRRWWPPRRRAKLSALRDADMRCIVGDGDVRLFAGPEAAELGRQLAWELRDAPTLKDAWRLFATYDAQAVKSRQTFERFQNSILGLGIIATLLALLASATGVAPLHWAAVAAPIVISSVIALASRRAAGKHWVHLRAAAECVKAEIYRFRTGTGAYADAKLQAGDGAARTRVLAQQVGRIDAALVQTDASSGSIPRYEGPLPPEMYGASRDDDGLSTLDPGEYLRIRIDDQVSYFTGRVRQLDRRRTALQTLAVIASGSGAILAAAGVGVWIGLTTAISGAALAYLSYLQVDSTIVTYNQAASKLRCLEREWSAGGPERHDYAAVEELVAHGEAILGAEMSGWVQQMTQVVNKMQEEQQAAAKNGGAGAAKRKGGT